MRVTEAADPTGTEAHKAESNTEASSANDPAGGPDVQSGAQQNGDFQGNY
ncbi:MAG: hypothetical protein ACRDOD_14365 [Streptosporangiaceae bacterium]